MCEPGLCKQRCKHKKKKHFQYPGLGHSYNKLHLSLCHSPGTLCKLLPQHDLVLHVGLHVAMIALPHSRTLPPLLGICSNTQCSLNPVFQYPGCYHEARSHSQLQLCLRLCHTGSHILFFVLMLALVLASYM